MPSKKMVIAENEKGLHVAPVMLTGKQLALARKVAGFESQRALASACDLSKATIERMEASGDEFPKIGADDLARLIQLFEAHGVEFSRRSGTSIAGGWRIGQKDSQHE